MEIGSYHKIVIIMISFKFTSIITVVFTFDILRIDSEETDALFKAFRSNSLYFLDLLPIGEVSHFFPGADDGCSSSFSKSRYLLEHVLSACVDVEP